MANEQHLSLLQHGIEEWNNWRKESDETPDLSAANLSNANFIGANLQGADLRAANLSNANLVEANLQGADLRAISLRLANLKSANLSKTSISGTAINLAYKKSSSGEADFSHLEEFKFTQADLRGANLRNASLHGADLMGVDLREADLREADFGGSALSGADFRNTNLRNAVFYGANLSATNFSGADLTGAFLFAVQALDTNFTAATLTGACIQDWNINPGTCFQNVICDYIFIGFDFTSHRITDRRPHDPTQTFAPGEFAALVQKSLETVDLIFIDGIDWKAFFVSFQELQKKYRDKNLGIQAIEKKDKGAFVIRLEVAPDADKAAIEQDSKALYEAQLGALEAQYQEQLHLQGANLEDARRTIEVERQEKATLMGIVATLASNQGAKYDLRGSNFGGGFATEGGTSIGGTSMTLNGGDRTED